MIPRRFFWLFDLACLSWAFLATYWLVPHLQYVLLSAGLLQLPWIQFLSPALAVPGQLLPFKDFVWVFCIMAPAAILVLAGSGNHLPLFERSYTQIVMGSLIASLSGVGLVALVLFTFKHPHSSRLFIYSFGLLSSLVLSGYRILLRVYFLRRKAAGYYTKNAILIGARSGLEWIVHYLSHRTQQPAYQLLGYLQLTKESEALGAACGTLPFLGEVHELGEILVQRPIHDVIVVYPVFGGTWLTTVQQTCEYLGVQLHIVPEALLSEHQHAFPVGLHASSLHLPSIVLCPLRHWDVEVLFFKRLFDLSVSALLLILLLPLFGLIGLAIKLSTPDLPILYRWQAVGQNGVAFLGYKFTTMEADAEQRKAGLLAYNEMSGPAFKMKDDPRITRLGRFLRKYSLDELPQLWCVLKGEMSLVGPRPPLPHEVERYAFWHKRKLSIKPGLTCLWQVRGRNQIADFDDWVKLDLEYIEHWSFWLDCKILLRTIRAIATGTGR